MLKGLADHVRACQVRAADCREKANSIVDRTLKSEYLELERRWMHLARSYEFVESLEHFLLDSRRAKGDRDVSP